MSLPWYEVVSGSEPLDQSDIILDCPVVGWREGPMDLRAGGDAAGHLWNAVEVTRADVVVMTQTCDLAQNKVRHVVLCPHYSFSVYREAWEAALRAAGQVVTTIAWSRHVDHIAAGQIWNLALLNAEQGEGYMAEHRIVDFQEVLSLPREFVESWLSKEAGTRLRLLPPYREHLSQAFARFFMRVGLPTVVRRDWR